MGSGGVAIAALPTVICLKVPFSDGLGGGIARSVTRIIIGRYKAFQRCLRASLEGFVMFVGSMTKVVKAIPRIGSMTNVIKVNIYGNQEVKRLTMR